MKWCPRIQLNLVDVQAVRLSWPLRALIFNANSDAIVKQFSKFMCTWNGGFRENLWPHERRKQKSTTTTTTTTTKKHAICLPLLWCMLLCVCMYVAVFLHWMDDQQTACFSSIRQQSVAICCNIFQCNMDWGWERKREKGWVGEWLSEWEMKMCTVWIV